MPVKSLDTDGVNLCGSVRSSAGCRCSAGIIAWRIPALWRHQYGHYRHYGGTTAVYEHTACKVLSGELSRRVTRATIEVALFGCNVFLNDETRVCNMFRCILKPWIDCSSDITFIFLEKHFLGEA